MNNRLLDNLLMKFGPIINAALEEPAVTEIMVNPDGTLWVESNGMMEWRGTMDAMDARTIISLVADSLGKIATVETPIVEGELPDSGYRFSGCIPPLVKQSMFTIRILASRIFTLDEYVANNIMSVNVQSAILHAIVEKKNILVVGGTGSGKTTLVNAIIHSMATLCPEDRPTILEDTRELQCASRNLVQLKTSEYKDMSDLLRFCMRIRPCRIIVGEVRGGEALALLKGWNTGHPGGVCTIHANNIRGGLIRLAQLISEASVSPMQELIGEAVDLMLFIRRAKETGRRVTQAAWVQGYDLTKQTYNLEMIHNEETS